MPVNIFKSIILLCSLSLLATSCLTKKIAVSNITVERKAIPPDFGEDESTLICVISGKNSYDKYMKKHVTNEFHGKYEFVLEDDLNLEKYNDTITYRFVFDRKIRKGQTSSFNYDTNKYDSSPTYSNSYFITDRKKNKTYQCPIRAASFSKLIEAYMINLEEVRLKNKK